MMKWSFQDDSWNDRSRNYPPQENFNQNESVFAWAKGDFVV